MRKYSFALAVFLMPMLLSAPAYASDSVGDGTGGSFGNRFGAQLVPITRALGDLADVMGQVFAIMVSNPLLVVFLAGSLFGVGICIFRKIKSAAK